MGTRRKIKEGVVCLLLLVFITILLITFLLRIKFNKIKILQYIWTCFLIIFLIIYIRANYFETGIFNQIVLKNFNNSQFVSITMIKHINDSNNTIMVKSSNNPNIIKNLLIYFDQFKLVQYNGKISDLDNCYYYIYLETSKPNEGVIIKITNKNYINVLLYTTKTYHIFAFNLYDNIEKNKNYKIVNKNINCNALDKLFNSIEE